MTHDRWTIRTGADLGRAVADIRHRRSMTQEELSAAAGIGRTWLAKLEAGRTATVLEHLLRLLRRLGATITITVSPEDGDRGPT